MYSKNRKIELLLDEITHLKEENNILKSGSPEKILELLADKEKEQIEQYKELENLKRQYIVLIKNIEKMHEEFSDYLSNLKKEILFIIRVKCFINKLIRKRKSIK